MSRQELRIGTWVSVRILKKRGTIESISPDGRFRVQVGAFSLYCTANELELCEEPAAEQAPSTTFVRTSGNLVPSSIDLHGLSAEEATRRVEDYLSQLALTGGQQASIMHGLGSGTVQRAVHALLSSLSIVRAFRLNDRNPGKTDVYLG